MIKLLMSINLSVKKWLKTKLISLLQSFIRRWGNILNINSMLLNSTGIKLVDLSYWAMNRYPNTYQTMTALDSAGISYLNKVKGTNMENMFKGCSSLTSLDASDWDTSNVTNMHSMFYNCSSLTSLDVSNWDTSNVAGVMYYMFYNCSSLTSLDASDWDISNVTNMSYMFQGCSSLTSLDVSNWDTSNVTHMYRMFYISSSLTYLIIGSPTFKFQMPDSNCGNLNTTCKILVPNSLLNTFKTATNWSSRASQFDAIEKYTITRSNGQVTVVKK